MRRRLTFTLVSLLVALVITALPETAAAAPASGAIAAHGTTSASATISRGTAAQSTRSACSLTGLVPARGANCPAAGRLRRQWLGIPSLPNPVHVVKKVIGGVTSTAIKAVALVAILGWVASGAESALKETAKVIDQTTSPQLTSSWFSASYWRIAGIAALLTVPFLCAAAIHALVRSDLGLLTRAAFGYLPLSLLAVGIASQLTMLLLAGTDEMSSIVASASAHADSVFLSTTSVTAIAESVATNDPFVTFLAAIITVAATLALWLELLVRNAAVYVIVLMLPLFFAAMVWPARRTLAIRAIETLIALILSKFAIVAVLSLGGSALGHSTIPGAASVLTGGTLVLLAAFTPWALLRMLPLHELASAAAGGLSQAPRQTLSTAARAGLELADGAVALGAGALGRSALPEGEPSMVGGNASAAGRTAGDASAAGRTAGDAGSELDTEPGWAEPVDPDVAGPVATAMSGSAGTGDGVRPETATLAGSLPDGVPGSEPAAAGTDDMRDSTTRQPDADTGSGQRWPEALADPGMAGDDDPELSLGDALLDLANQRQSPPVVAEDSTGPEPTRAIDAPAPALEPPGPPARDTIGLRPSEPRRPRERSEAEPPSTPRVEPPPELGFDPFGEHV
ncbi:MAG: hypothetical protein WAL22_17570 [Solirubrobacteraceae bacterium]